MSRLTIGPRPVGRQSRTAVAVVLGLAIVLVAVIALAGVHGVAAASPSDSDSALAPAPDEPAPTLENATDPTPDFATTDAGGATIDPALENASGEIRVIVEFEPSDVDATADARRAHATATQAPLEAYAAETAAVDLERGFWIANVALVTVDTERASFEEVAAVPNATAVRPEEVVTPDRADATDEAGASLVDEESSTAPSYADGLEQLAVPRAWDEFDTRGENTTVAVLDSGVDGDHPDLEIDGWKDFSADPSEEPVDYDGHGTHVTGIVGAGNESGTHLGVAPEAELLHGAVITECEDRCVGRESVVLSGLEWAVEADADVVTMSLGWSQFRPSVIRAVEHANDAGTVVVAGAGNGGEGTSLSPANVYDSIAVGAIVDPDRVAGFSAGEEIDTDDAWGSAALDHWPDTYVVPDIVAPGAGIESTAPGGEYDSRSGTSKAAPHVAGTVALAQSATADDLEPKTVAAALETTAWKPDGEPEQPDTRYGAGIVDAVAAIDEVGDHGAISGTVTDGVTNASLEGATVEIVAEDGESVETTTDADGAFERLGLDPGAYEVVVEKPGYGTAHESMTVDTDEQVALEIALAGAGEIEATVTDVHFESGIGDATVVANGSYGTYPGTVENATDGTYRIANVPAKGDEYVLEFRADGYEDATQTVTITGDGDRKTVAESVALEGDAALEITVESEDGGAIPDAELLLERDDGTAAEIDDRTDENGTVLATVPGTGEAYVLEASADGFTTDVVETSSVESGVTETVTVVLAEPLLPMPGFGVAVAALALSLALAAVALLATRAADRQ
ncbi:S8 family serine peptidase [Halobiforma nitratireducens]|uniref:Peptidase S8 and S53 subtilisin kexin sedolisin n=1 Tax=Halobiforma nitratireducens JCM 10879 TaxID=1227454 RepID=M0LSF9_9EURY|nr:S8 family serine peptidase [Halobiforma nitratireducens]EMA35364.1 peptidase S8 and S53 subtilisin kexin sedolisin [Halobiforma nitratireducens JCM 10879]